MDIVALVTLAGSVDEEAPKLAADLGITAYEAALLLRVPMPAIVLRAEDRTRTLDLLGKLRARGHDALACDLAAVVSSANMFRPKSFRLEGTTIVGIARNEEQHLALAAVVALVRAVHVTHHEEAVIARTSKLSLGRIALTGGLMLTKTTSKESTHATTEREPVLYVFRNDGPPWLLVSSDLRYDGLAERMAISKLENFELLVRWLREGASAAPFDARLLQARLGATVVAASAKQFSTSSADATDVLAHVVATALDRAARPYR